MDKRVDEYISKAKPFAQPILKHLRMLVHKAVPDVEEKIKWGFPNFDYKGPLCRMASFKERLNEEGIKLPVTTKVGKPKPQLVIPEYFMKAVKKNKIAFDTFENFSPSHKREYVEWITEAKTEATRDKRLAAAIEMMTEGKSRNWKYEKRK